jgi:5-methyltetrahydrofolate--homocysteine methyltransferase
VNLTLGASNVSYGLPDRDLLNGYFIAMAIAAGVNCPIVDPGKALAATRAADLLAGRDEWAQNYLSYYRATHPEA